MAFVEHISPFDGCWVSSPNPPPPKKKKKNPDTTYVFSIYHTTRRDKDGPLTCMNNEDSENFRTRSADLGRNISQMQ